MFLVDPEYEELILSISEDAAGLRIPISQGVAGYVARTAQIVNIPDAYRHARRDRELRDTSSASPPRPFA